MYKIKLKASDKRKKLSLFGGVYPVECAMSHNLDDFVFTEKADKAIDRGRIVVEVDGGFPAQVSLGLSNLYACAAINECAVILLIRQYQELEYDAYHLELW